MNDKIINIISDIIGKTEDDIVQDMDTIGIFESLTFVEIIFSLEDEFSITFEEADLETIKTYRNLVDMVKAKAESCGA